MKHDRLLYKRTENLGNYCSETVEIVAALEEEDDVTLAFNSLRNWVEEEIGVRQAYKDVLNEHQSLTEQIHNLRVQREELIKEQAHYNNLIEELQQQYAEISQLPEFINKLPETAPKSLPTTIDDIPY